MVKVMLVDDHAMIRAGCRRVLEDAGDFEIVGEAGSAEEALPMVRALQPAVVLMDIHLPGANGLQATERLASTHPEVRVIVFTLIDELPMPQRLLEAGAWGYLTKSAPAEELVSAVRQVSQGRRYLNTEIASKLALSTVFGGGKASPLESLTSRELEVAIGLAQGKSNKDVARDLHISEKTVSTHKTHVLQKLGVASVVALANMMAHHKLLEPGPDSI